MSLAENFASVQQQIRVACERAGRVADSVTLLAVSKTHPAEMIQAAVDCGQIFFGESKIQEAKAKIPLCPGR
ncbi:MAG TPA: YggS family pyridoxal phosphate-dependent enzyme, partial [Verrucomicrobiae bacterium]|nr:YggS family pyridoxal phosphate-dependent enzyme [Verrucomicrobiae bacterium]